MSFAWKLHNKEKNNRYATCVAAAIRSQAFVTFSVKLYSQTWTFLVADNSEKLLQSTYKVWVVSIVTNFNKKDFIRAQAHT